MWPRHSLRQLRRGVEPVWQLGLLHHHHSQAASNPLSLASFSKILSLGLIWFCIQTCLIRTVPALMYIAIQDTAGKSSVALFLCSTADLISWMFIGNKLFLEIPPILSFSFRCCPVFILRVVGGGGGYKNLIQWDQSQWLMQREREQLLSSRVTDVRASTASSNQWHNCPHWLALMPQFHSCLKNACYSAPPHLIY